MSSTRSSVGRILLSHAASAGVMVGLMLWAKESPRPAIYGFFVAYLYRLLTLAALQRLHDAGSRAGRALARALSRPPHPARPSQPVTEGEGAAAVPARFRIYCLVLALLAAFSFVMINVENRQIAVPLPVAARELGWGLVLGGVWWLLDLVDRRVTIRFGRPLTENLGYNSAETTVLALSMLSGGAISALVASPWPFFVALLAWKTLFDAWDEAHYPRGEHPAPGAGG